MGSIELVVLVQLVIVVQLVQLVQLVIEEGTVLEWVIQVGVHVCIAKMVLVGVVVVERHLERMACFGVETDGFLRCGNGWLASVAVLAVVPSVLFRRNSSIRQPVR